MPKKPKQIIKILVGTNKLSQKLQKEHLPNSNKLSNEHKCKELVATNEPLNILRYNPARLDLLEGGTI
jgi:hypothetical protein